MFRARGLAAGTVLWVNHGCALKNFGARGGEFYQKIWRGMSVFIEGVRRETKKQQALDEFMPGQSLQTYVPTVMGN